MADKTKKALHREALNEQNDLIADARLHLVELLGEMEELGGEEDCKVTIRKALDKFGGEVPLAVISRAFDVTKLTEARKEMREGKKANKATRTPTVEPEIQEDKDENDKTKRIIKWVKAPAGGAIIDVVADVAAVH